jgi:transposase
LRAILDAVFYVLKSGCPWRLLPSDFPPWKTVYDWFEEVAYRWDMGTLECRIARAAALSPWQESEP